ncbi:scarecrow-like protein 8 [Lotus japonicus]|uniref:scarecrow-like protein 8 n=1 Tax=Lotus japonicus TaxID=34305 RepID=UPI00259010F6|nr:scarecrow-like protein 8 [Lotus japonicus]
MSSGFTGGGGGAPEFFTGRSTINNLTTTVPITNNLHHHSLYRTQQQQQQHHQSSPIFLDPSSQFIQRQTPTTTTTTFTGKRTLAEFQTQHHQNQIFNNNNSNSNSNSNFTHNQFLSNLLLRSVKPRTTMFPHMDFSVPSQLQNPNNLAFQTQRLGVPLLHQLRPQPINLPDQNFPYRNSNLGLNRVQNQSQTDDEPEKKIMNHQLLELEKQLLEDNDEGEEPDAASVITTSEWSETYQNLIGLVSGSGSGSGLTQKPASSSPTSSTTSSTSSSAASPASVCSKQTLMEAASAIAEGKNDAASEILTRLVNPTGNSDQRLTDCMVLALKSRMSAAENPPPVAELFSREHAESTQLLLENSPCFKVGLMAANLVILEAAFEENVNGKGFCVVDFEIGQGKQYFTLLHALSTRGQNGKVPPPMKIAAVAESGGEERVRAVGEMLSRQAERLRIGFEFRVVSVPNKLADLTRESLGCDSEETLVVNLAFKLNRIPDESVSTENPRDELLRRVKKLAPRVVTVLEQEVNANTAPFLARVAESWSYYSALFDSVESAMGKENPDRVKVEEGLSRKLCNSVACEGRDRVERCEVFGKWRARMSMAGFQLKPLSQNLAESINSRLAAGNNRVNPGLTVKEENGGICFGWMGRTLTVASAWR